MNIDMWTQIIIALIGGGVISSLALWVVFFKWKRGALIAKLAKETAVEKSELYDQLDSRIEKMGLKIEQLRTDLFASESKGFTMRKHIGVLFNTCKCNNTPEVIEIRRLYNEQAEEIN
jgi:hypothetical protein